LFHSRQIGPPKGAQADGDRRPTPAVTSLRLNSNSQVPFILAVDGRRDREAFGRVLK
jgi:hypothetical protein